MSKRAVRNKQLHMLLSKEERAWLESTAAERGLNLSDVMRQLIRERWKKEFPGRAADLRRRITEALPAEVKEVLGEH